MAAVWLTPEALVEVDDVMSGGRKIGYVDATGLGYFDVHGEGELPKVLNEELHPVELGTIGSWVGPLPDERLGPILEAWQAMADANVDQLTIARAIRWGISNESDDSELMLRMGKAETERVRTGHKIVDSASRA